MQAYKLKGTIDRSGHLIISDLIEMAPGEVEVIILQQATSVKNATILETESQPQTAQRKRQTKISALKDWFEKTQPAPPNFDSDQARREGLKEKYEL